MMRPPSAHRRLSVVVVCLNEGSHTTRTLATLRSTLPDDSEIILVDDGSTDGGPGSLPADPRLRLLRSSRLGVAGARNYGAVRATGDVLIFADAHIEMPPGWWQPLAAALEDPAVGAAAPPIADADRPGLRGYGLRFADAALQIEWLRRKPRGSLRAPILPGCCLAMRRDVFRQIGGFDAGLIRWGEVDNELAVRLWLLGFTLRVVPDVTVTHLFRARHPYQVQWKCVLHNKLRLALVHFAPPRIAAVVSALREHPAFPDAIGLLDLADVGRRRTTLAARRVHDDDWYFGEFREWSGRTRPFAPPWRVLVTTSEGIAGPQETTTR